jgi:hypothetical protein
MGRGVEAAGDGIVAGTDAFVEATGTGYAEMGRGLEAAGDGIVAGTDAFAEATGTGYAEMGRGVDYMGDLAGAGYDVVASEAAPIMSRYEDALASRRGQVSSELYQASVETEVGVPVELEVKASILRVRTSPSVHADQSGVVKKGEKVSVLLDPPEAIEEDGYKWASCDQGWVAVGKSDGSATYLG